MNDRLRRLLEERAAAWNDVQDIRGRIERENRDLTAEEDTAFARALDEVDRLSRLIDSEERAARLADTMNDAVVNGDAAVNQNAARRGGDYGAVFTQFLRRGIDSLDPEARAMLEAHYEERALGEASDAAGGYLVPAEFLAVLQEAMLTFGGLLNVVNVVETQSGAPLSWPTVDDTTNVGAILAENTQVTEQDIVFANAQLGAYTYTSKLVRVSLQLLQDAAFNLDRWLPGALGARIGRAVSAHIATGSGVGQPQGIVTGAGTGVTGAVGQTTSVTADDLISLIHSVDPAYRGQARFALNDQTLATIRKLKDSSGDYLWQPSVVAGVADTLLGYPIVIDQGIPGMAASARPILFGDFAAGYTVRRVRGAQTLRLTERYADFLQVGFLGFLRLDGKVVNAAAVKAYVNSAT